MSPIVLCAINGKFCNHNWFMMCSMRIFILVSGEAPGLGLMNRHSNTHGVFLVGAEARHYDQFPTSQLVFFYWFLLRSRHSTHLHWWTYVSACITWLKHCTVFLCNLRSIRFYVSYNVIFCNHTWGMMCSMRIFIMVSGEDLDLAL